MQGIVEIIIPLRLVGAPQPSRLVALVLQHEVSTRHLGTDRIAELLQEAVIIDGVHCIQAQPVKSILLQPHQRVVDEEALHMRLFEVDGLTPRRAAPAVEEALGILRQMVALWPEMVVDHVKQHRQAGGMRRIYEALECIGPAIGLCRGVGKRTVIAPVAAAWKLRHRHQLNGGDARGRQHRQLRRQRGKPAGGFDVHLVDHHVRPGHAAPVLRLPGMGILGQHGAGAFNALGLPARSGIGHLAAIRQTKTVAIALHRRRADPMQAIGLPKHR